MMRRCFALFALALGVLVWPGCDPTLDAVDGSCQSAVDCALGKACDPRTDRCVDEPQDSLLGRFTCRVFDDVVPPGSKGTSDVVGAFEGTRLQLQGGSACFSNSVQLEASVAPDGTLRFLSVILPEGFTGGTVNLGPSNAFFYARGGGRTQLDVEHGSATGVLQIPHYAVGATVEGAIIVTPSRACGTATGPFCPAGQRCAALFRARGDEGICVSTPAISACTDNTDCQLGEGCVAGVCSTLCTAEGCLSGQLCADVNDATFVQLRVGVCKPPDQVAKLHDPCSDGVACTLGALCVAFPSGSVCSDFCQSNLSCGMGYGCIVLSNGQMVCASGTATAGQSCANGEHCTYDSVCLGVDNICHELCTHDGDCPAARPTCLSLMSGREACGP